MLKTLVIAGFAVAAGVIGGDMIDAKVGPGIAGEKNDRATLRRGVKIGIQTGLAVVLFGVVNSVL